MPFKKVALICLFISNSRGWPFPHTPDNTGYYIFNLLIFRWKIRSCFICKSLMPSKVDYVFMCLLDICISLLTNYLITWGSQIFSNGMLIFFLMIYKSSLLIICINYINFSSHLLCLFIFDPYTKTNDSKYFHFTFLILSSSLLVGYLHIIFLLT